METGVVRTMFSSPHRPLSVVMNSIGTDTLTGTAPMSSTPWPLPRWGRIIQRKSRKGEGKQ